MPQVLIFDFDGTIADTIPGQEVILDVFNTIALELGRKEVELSEIRKYKNMSLFESIKDLKIPLYRIPFIARRVRILLKTDVEVGKPIKGMPKTLAELKKRGYILGISTSNKKETVKKFLEEHKMKMFDFLYSGTNLFGKDRMLRKIIKKEGLEPQNVTYLGDEIRDVQAAKKVGIKTLAVLWGFNGEKGLKAANPDYIAKNPSDLLKILK